MPTQNSENKNEVIIWEEYEDDQAFAGELETVDGPAQAKGL